MKFLNSLAAGLPDNLEDIASKLEQIAEIVLKPGLARVMVTADEATWASGAIEPLIETLPAGADVGYINGSPRIIPNLSKTYLHSSIWMIATNCKL